MRSKATAAVNDLPVLALGLRQFALSELKSNLANDSAIKFRQICAAGEIHSLVARRRLSRLNHVFGIVGKLFNNARKWCLFYANILKTLRYPSLKSKIQYISFRFWAYFPHFYDDYLY